MSSPRGKFLSFFFCAKKRVVVLRGEGSGASGSVVSLFVDNVGGIEGGEGFMLGVMLVCVWIGEMILRYGVVVKGGRLLK